MIDSIYLYPSLVIESLSMFFISKYIQICPNYGLSLTGAIFTTVSLLELFPNDIRAKNTWHYDEI